MDNYTLGAILYEGFELLDLFGPLEMFGNLKPRVQVVMVAETAGPVESYQGPKALAEYGFLDCPGLDLILVPGGLGTISGLKNRAMLEFLKMRVPAARVTMSVCSGSWLLAKAGLLDGRRATSNKLLFDVGREVSGKVQWETKARWVKDGSFVTSSGVSAGMDMALAVIADLFGKETAHQLAIGTEYQWQIDPRTDPFHQYLNQYDPALMEQLKSSVRE